MIEAITMPRWGMAMEEGTVAAWHREEGDSVVPGDEIVDVESTKASNALEAHMAGVLRRRLAQPGSIQPVGGLLGVIAAAHVPESEIDSFVLQFAAAAATIEAKERLPTARRFEVGSRHINCLIEGEGSPVLLIHGFGGSIEAWSAVQPALARRHRVVAMDLPGHGNSDEAVEEGTIQDLAGVVAPLLDALAIDKAHVVGHSLGGAIAAAAAVADPSRVRSLILIAPCGLGPEIDSAYLEGYLAARRRRDLRPHIERLFADPAMVSERMLEDLIRLKRIGGAEKALRKIAEQLISEGHQRDTAWQEKLAQLTTPLLVLWGDDDRIIPPAHGDLVGAVRIAGAGHMPQLERPAEVSRLILAQLARVETAI